ncbi:MAG: hypothetical protein AAGE76_03665 [Pseudomonadota bacterium]
MTAALRDRYPVAFTLPPGLAMPARTPPRRSGTWWSSRPAFINLSRIHFERFLVQAIQRANTAGARIDLRGKTRVDALHATENGASRRTKTTRTRPGRPTS